MKNIIPMKSIITLCAVAAGMLGVAPVFGAVVMCGIYESPIECQKRADLEALNEKAYADGVKAKDQFNRQIEEARARFWATYPDKPGAEEARIKFAAMLREKDIHYLILYVSFPQYSDLPRDTPQGAVADLFDRYVGGVPLDHGVPTSARPEFFDWSDAFRKNLAAVGGLFTFQASTNAFKALAASQKEYDAYVLERDWAEFDAMNRVPVAYEAPRNYAAMLYFRFGKVPLVNAVETVAAMVKLLGAEAVDSAALQVKNAPKGPSGNLVVTTPEPLKIGPGGTRLPDNTIPASPNVIGSFAGPLGAMEALATRTDDRRYLLGLIANNAAAPPAQSRHIGKWDRAGKTYDRYVAAFGEPEVVAVSHQVRVATKRMTDGYVMDPGALGSTRMAPYSAFEDVLARKDPRGYVRSMLAFEHDLNSKAGLDAAYRDFLTGKSESNVLETAGKMAAGRPELALDFKEFSGALNGSVSLDKPVRPTVDDWQYVSWKGFSPGAKASYVLRGLAPDRPGSTNLVPGNPTSRSTFTLQSITAEQARLFLTEIAYNYPGGRADPPHDTEVNYGATRPVPLANPRVAATVEKGDETLDIKGQRLATRWQSVATSYNTNRGTCTSTTKTWIADQVPGGVVRMLQQDTCPTPRTRETILESFTGTRQPGLTDIFEPRAEPVSGGAPASPASTPGSVPPRARPASDGGVPAPRVAPAEPTSAVSPQMRDLNDRYNSIRERADRTRADVTQIQQRQISQGVRPNAEISNARNRLELALRSAGISISRGDATRADVALRSAEDALGVIEKFLGR